LARTASKRSTLPRYLPPSCSYLTEINVTSPTGIRAVKNFGGPDVAAMIWDKIEAKRRE
jgi:glutathione synthase/RimK-type ligase-like ATP-grasp enzyme